MLIPILSSDLGAEEGAVRPTVLRVKRGLCWVHWEGTALRFSFTSGSFSPYTFQEAKGCSPLLVSL